MPAFNFKKEFAEAVEFGYKQQTIRALRKDGRPHCKVGDTIKLYTGMRTKSCRLLDEVKVTRIDDVEIRSIEMFLNGVRLYPLIYDRDAPQTDNEFAEADGFAGFTEMADWFDKVHGLPFKGQVIYWGEPQ
jgi:hypothetical protein